jgi:hypothetical protein
MIKPGDAPRDMFIKATFALAKRNPSEWAEFNIAFNAYTVDEMEHAAGTSTESLAVSTGMSRRMVSLRNDFRDIEMLMNRVSGANNR